MAPIIARGGELNTEEIQRIAELIVSGSPAMSIRAYAGASAYIRLLIDRLAIEIQAEDQRRRAAMDVDDDDLGYAGP